jgi:hypothetical protein
VAIIYPTELPIPQTSQVTSAERRVLESRDYPSGQATTRQRDRKEYERITWPPLDQVQAGVLRNWWKVTLLRGGAWFECTWPLPRGMVAAVRKFTEPLDWEWMAGGFWRVSGLTEVRGRGMTPQYYPALQPDWHLHLDVVLDYIYGNLINEVGPVWMASNLESFFVEWEADTENPKFGAASLHCITDPPYRSGASIFPTESFDRPIVPELTLQGWIYIDETMPDPTIPLDYGPAVLTKIMGNNADENTVEIGMGLRNRTDDPSLWGLMAWYEVNGSAEVLIHTSTQAWESFEWFGWHYMEVTRDADMNLRLFVDGQQMGEPWLTPDDVGGFWYAPNAGNAFRDEMRMDELRGFLSTCLHTDSFDPPTEPF